MMSMSFLADPIGGKGQERQEAVANGESVATVYDQKSISEYTKGKIDGWLDNAMSAFSALHAEHNSELMRMASESLLKETGTLLKGKIVQEILAGADKIDCSEITKNIDLKKPLKADTLVNLCNAIESKIEAVWTNFAEDLKGAGDVAAFKMLLSQVLLAREPKIRACMLLMDPAEKQAALQTLDDAAGHAGYLANEANIQIQKFAKAYLSPAESEQIENDTASADLRKHVVALLTHGSDQLNNFDSVVPLDGKALFKNIVGKLDFAHEPAQASATAGEMASMLSTMSPDTRSLLQSYVQKLGPGTSDSIGEMGITLASLKPEAIAVARQIAEIPCSAETHLELVQTLATMPPETAPIISPFMTKLDFANEPDDALNLLAKTMEMYSHVHNIDINDPQGNDPTTALGSLNAYFQTCLQEQGQKDMQNADMFDENGVSKQFALDVNRERCTVNGTLYNAKLNEAMQATMDALPGINARKFITSILHQGAWADMSQLSTQNVANPPKGSTLIPTITTEQMPVMLRNLAAGMGYGLQVSKDGNTATLTLEITNNLSAGMQDGLSEEVNNNKEMGTYGHLKMQMQVEVDLTNDAPKVTSTTFAQQILPANG